MNENACTSAFLHDSQPVCLSPVVVGVYVQLSIVYLACWKQKPYILVLLLLLAHGTN